MKIKNVVQIGLLIALQVILSRFFSIATPIVKISFGYLPIALIAMMYGPVYSSLAGGVSDLIGALLFPIGPYFIGFTISAFITGLIFGVFFYGNYRSLSKTAIGVVANALCVTLLLNSLWIWMLYDKAFIPIVASRIIQVLVIAPIQIGTIYYSGKYVQKLNKY